MHRWSTTVFTCISSIVVNLGHSITWIWSINRIISALISSIVGAKPVAGTAPGSWTRPLNSDCSGSSVYLGLNVSVPAICYSRTSWICRSDRICFLLVRWNSIIWAYSGVCHRLSRVWRYSCTQRTRVWRYSCTQRTRDWRYSCT